MRYNDVNVAVDSDDGYMLILVSQTLEALFHDGGKSVQKLCP